MRCALTPLLVLAACAGDGPAPRPMVLEGIRPRQGQGLYLNEELVLSFSHEVDPTTITSTSLSIVAADGHRAQGEWQVSGRVLRFVPRPVLRPSLDDGGYHPGTGYVLEAVGFPRLDGLRSIGGEPLERSFRWEFSTVEVGPERHGVVFDDASPERAYPLRPDASYRSGARLAPWSPLVLTCAEPLDPSSVRGEDFLLVEHETTNEAKDGKVQRVTRDREVPLVAVVRANHPEGSVGTGGACCELELFPREPLRPGEYTLSTRRVLSLADFRGNPVPPGFSVLSIRVERPNQDTERRRPTLTFLDPDDRSPLKVPGTDGLALWEGGRVSVRFPAAAGSGDDGAVDHGHELARADVHATRVVVPAGERLTLAPGRGLRVLRAQHELQVAGELGRTIDADIAARGPAEGDDPFRPGETLSAWLERVAAEDWDWTVLVAGGDLVVSGSIVVDTPLLLVAGGWIRVEGTVSQTPGQLWLLRDGGGVADPTASVPDLILDSPRTNPLREPFRVGVVSSPLPSTVRPYRWLGVDADGHSGAGRWTIGFLPPRGPVDRALAVGHPRLLPTAGPLRVLIELEVPPGAAWDPPFVDYVDLLWEVAE